MSDSRTTPSRSLIRLSYASVRQTRRWRRVLGICFLIVVVGVCGRYGSSVLRKAQIFFVQWRCLHSGSENSNVPVYAYVLNDDRDSFFQQFPTVIEQHPGGSVAIGGRVAGDLQWLRMRIWSDPDLSPTDFKPWGTVFLGSLRAPDGQTKLVAVNISEDYSVFGGKTVGSSLVAMGGNGRWRPIGLEINVIDPAGIFSAARWRSGILPTDLYDRWSRANPARITRGLSIYPGRLDTRDESCFRSRVTIGTESGELVGKLKPDGTVDVSIQGFDALKKP
jgi:hypothetical protein